MTALHEFRKQRFLALTAALSFLLYSLIPFFATHPPAFAAAQQSSAASTDTILICTSYGFRYITLEEFQKGTHTPASQSNGHCPLCYFSAHSAVITPESVAFSVPSQGLLYSIARTGNDNGNHKLTSWYRLLTRSPPAHA